MTQNVEELKKQSIYGNLLSQGTCQGLGSGLSTDPFCPPLFGGSSLLLGTATMEDIPLPHPPIQEIQMEGSTQ